MSSVGWHFTLAVIFLYILTTALSIYSNFWLSEWSNDHTRDKNGTYDTKRRDLRLGVYGALGFSQGTAFICSGYFYIAPLIHSYWLFL